MKSQKLFHRILILTLIITSFLLSGNSSADPLDRWLWRDPIPQVGFVSKITYGNGMFVAVGGAISSSPDGMNWTVRVSDLSNPLSGVAFGTGTFAAVGTGGKVLTSTDGINWTAIDTQIKDDLNDVVFGGGIFVAIGAYTNMTSPDGINWTIISTGNPVTGGIARDAVHLAYGNGTFVTVGVNGGISTSPDGLNWTQRNINGPITDHFSEANVTYGNGTFVVMGWRGQPLISPGVKILSSPDGVTWIEKTLESPNQLIGITNGNGVFVAVGDNGTILTSPDSVNWTTSSSGTTKSLSVAAYENGMFVAIGNGIVLISSDGVKWTVLIDGNINDLYGAAYGKGTYVAVGDKGTILYSYDGTDWKSVLSGTTSKLRRVAYGSGLFVALGDNDTLLTSSDGVKWNTGNSTNMHSLNDMTFGNGIFIAVGDNGTILTSSDGLTWTERTSGTPNQLLGITYGNGAFVAVGSDQIILSSSDGINWTERRSGISSTSLYGTSYGSLYGVAYGNGIFVAVGFISVYIFGPPEPLCSMIYTSSDGVNWTAGPDNFINCSSAFSRITFGNGNFLAVNNGVSSSFDGVNWTGRIPAYFRPGLQEVTYGNGRFLTVGRNGAILQPDSENGDCAATLSSGLQLHIPVINFHGQSYWADFQVISDTLEIHLNTLEIQLTNYGLLTDIRPFANCRPALVSPDLTLHSPTILFGGVSYLADFQYSHDSVLSLFGVGQKTTNTTPYLLASSSTYQEGCVSPCLCPITIGRQILGAFKLIQLNSSPAFDRYSLDDISWTVASPDGTVMHTITGFGIYQTGGDFAKTHRLVLELSIDNSDLMHFDSGLVPDSFQFPAISISVDRGSTCYDIFMNIVASPRE